MARRSIGGVGETTESKEIHGISGLEKALDSLLYGKIGYSKMINLTKRSQTGQTSRQCPAAT